MDVNAIHTGVYDFDHLSVNNEAAAVCKQLITTTHTTHDDKAKLEKILTSLKTDMKLRFTDLVFIHKCQVKFADHTGG